jgi:glutaredoxin
MGRIIIWVTPGCKACTRIKSLFNEMEARFEEIDLMQDMSRRAELFELSGGKKTVPQVFFNDRYVGGVLEIEALADSGQLRGELERALNDADGGPPLTRQAAPVPASSSSSSSSSSTSLSTSSSLSSSKDGNVASGAANVFKRSALDIRVASVHRKMMERKGGVAVRDRRSRLKVHRKCVKGSALVEWLIASGEVKRKSDAVIVCEHLLAHAYMYRLASRNDASFSTAPSAIYRFHCSVDKRVLNMAHVFKRVPRDANVVARELNATVLKITDRYVSADGRGVDYEAIARSEEFADYAERTHELQELDVSVLTSEQRLAFFINIYNMLMVHASIALGQPKSALQRATFFGRVGYVISGFKFTLSEIEHGVLRCNRKPPGLFASKCFKRGHPKLRFALKEFDPRIHFMLVCGAASCPPLRCVDFENIENALQWATEGFVQEEVAINLLKRKMKASMLFRWYARDFGKTDRDVMEWIMRYVPEKPEYASLDLSKFRLAFFEYSWDSNGRGYDEDEAAGGTAAAASSSGQSTAQRYLRSKHATLDDAVEVLDSNDSIVTATLPRQEPGVNTDSSILTSELHTATVNDDDDNDDDE